MKSSTSEPGLRVIIIVAANAFNIYDCNMNLIAGYLDWILNNSTSLTSFSLKTYSEVIDRSRWIC